MRGFTEWAKTPPGMLALFVAAVTVPAALTVLFSPDSPPWAWAGLGLLLVLLTGLGVHEVVTRARRARQQERDAHAAEVARLEETIETLKATVEQQDARVAQIHERLLALADDPDRALKCSLVARLDGLDASFKVEWVDDDQHLGLRAIQIAAALLDAPGYHGLRLTVHTSDLTRQATGTLTRVDGDSIHVRLDAPAPWVESEMPARQVVPDGTTDRDRDIGAILLDLDQNAPPAAPPAATPPPPAPLPPAVPQLALPPPELEADGAAPRRSRNRVR